MMSSAAFRALLEAGDVDGIRAAWATLFPGLPQPESREAAEIAMHHARTGAESVATRHRFWSHRWLNERGLPSALPDRLRPSAERLYPIVREAVGISVNFRSSFMKGAEVLVRGAMENAVEHAYADGHCGDAEVITARMAEAKAREMKALFGRLPA